MLGRTGWRTTGWAATVATALSVVAPAVGFAQNVPTPNPAPQPKSQTPAPAPRPPSVTQQRPAQPQQPAQQQQQQPKSDSSSIFPNIFKPPAIFGGGGGATAFDAKQRGMAEKVSNYLSNIRQLHGNFVQIAPDGSKSEGEFYLQKPGKVRFDYNAPSPIELIADGSSVVVRDRKLATQDLYPLSQTPLRFLLADRVDLMRDTNVIGVYADDVFVTVVVEERQILGGTHKLMMMFGAQDYQLRQWTVTDPQGYDTTIAVYNLDQRAAPDPNMFRIDYTRNIQ